MSHLTCLTCKFFNNSECLRYPASIKVQGEAYNAHIKVHPSDYCGEYQDKVVTLPQPIKAKGAK